MNFKEHFKQGQGKRKQWRWYLKEDTVDERTRVNGPIYGWETQQEAEDDFKEIVDFIVKKYGGFMSKVRMEPWVCRMALWVGIPLDVALIALLVLKW